MRRTWFLSLMLASGCGDSGGANDGGTDSDTDTDTDTDTTDGTDVTSSPTTMTTTPSTSANPTVGTVTVTSLDTGTETDITTGPVEPGFYVHASLGADSNPGTPDEPVRTVQRGIVLAVEQGIPFVYVAAGDYPVASDTGDVVEVLDGLSVQGGYAPDDWSVRNPVNFVSRIVDTAVAPAGATATNPHRAVHVGADAGPETRIDGFTIEASSQPNSAGLMVEGGTPVIVGCTLLGGGGGFSSAVFINGGSPRLFRNTIDGVASAEPQPSFAVRGIDCAPNLQSNILRSGEGTNNRTVFFDGCTGVVANSVIIAERGFGGGVRAFELTDSTTQIVSNTVVVDSEAVGFFVLAGGTGAPASISSNNFVLASGTAWCYSHVDDLDAASFHNNNLGCTNLYASATVYNTLVELEAGHPDAADNVDVESGVVDVGSDWHLRSDGTTLCAVARGGIDTGLAATADVEGVARTEPWSIGAYELDSSCL